MDVDRAAIGRQVGEEVRAETLAAIKAKGPSIQRLITGLREALNAKTQKAWLNKDGQVVYSDPMTDNKVRLEAVKLGLLLYDAMPQPHAKLTHEAGDSVMSMVAEILTGTNDADSPEK